MSDYFNPQPKPEKKEKSVDKNYWNNLRLKSMKKNIEKNAEQIDKDFDFYLECFKNFYKNDEWFCRNCQGNLPEYDGSEDSFKAIRMCLHHICPKAKYKHLRYVSENIIPLCWLCHSKAESAISYPKMFAYNMMEEKKKLLLQ